MAKKSGKRPLKQTRNQHAFAENSSNQNSRTKKNPKSKTETKKALQTELPEVRIRSTGDEEELCATSHTQLDLLEAKRRIEKIERQLRERTLELETRNENLRAAQEQLEASRRRFADLYDSAPVGYFSIDKTGLVREVNLAGANLLAVNNNELLNKPFSRFIHDRDGQLFFRSHVQETFSTLKRQVCELKLKRRDGSLFYALVESIPAENKDGSGHIRTVVSDISERRKMEQALRDSEERFRTLGEAVFEGIAISENGTVIEANEQFALMHGYSPAEVTGMPVAGFLVSGDRGKVAESSAGTDEKVGEYQGLKKDGSTFCAEARGRTTDLSGRTLRVTAIRDMTERKRTEEALRNGLSRFELLARTAADLLHAGDLQRLVESVCRRVMEYLGCDVFFYYEADEKAGKLRLKLHAGVSEAEAGQIGWLDYGEGICGRVASDGCRIVAEHISTRPESRTELMRSFGVTAYACHPLYGFNGRVTGTLAFGTRRRLTFTARDLDMMKAVADQVAISLVKISNEEALRESEERYRLLVEVSPDAILIHDGSVFLFVNSSAVRLLGFKSPEKLIGLNIFSVLHPDFHEIVRERIAAMKSATGILPREIRMLRSDGTAINVESMGTPMVLNGKQVFQIVIRDITERKRAEEEIQQSNRVFDAVVNNTHLLMACLDNKFNFVWVNNAYARADERKPEYFPGRNHFALYPNEENEAIFRNAAATGKPVFIESKPFEYKDHPERGISYWDWALIPIVDERTGSVERLVLTLLNITERKRAEEKIIHQNSLLEGINLIFQKSMGCDTEEDLGRLCLEVAEKVTGSRFGFIGKIGSDGLLHNLVISDLGWEQCRMRDKTGHGRPPGNFKIHGLYGRVLLDGKSFFTNDPAGHKNNIGLPDGHPPLTAFLGAPLTHAGRTIGMLGLGNREGGYRTRDQEAVDALAAVMVQVFLRLRAEEGLRKNQEQLREYVTLLEYAPLMVRNMKEEIILWNKGMERIYGYSSAEAIGRKEHQLLRTEFPQPLREILKTIEREGKWEGEVQHVTRDGRTISVSSLWVLHKQSDGRPTAIIEINSDISERRRAEEQLRRLNEELESRVRERTADLAATIGTLQTEISDRIRAEHALRESQANLARAQSIAHIGSWSYDLLSKKAVCSEELYKIFGLKPDDIEGDLQSIITLVHPDDREKVSKGVRQIVTKSHAEPLECRIILPDGKERVIWGMAEAICGKKGKPLMILGTVQDITERKRADEELIRLATAVESAADAVVVTEPARGIIQYVNPAFKKITGYSREEVLGRDIHVLESGRQDEEFFRKLREALRKDGVWTGRMIHKKKDGSLYEEECTYSPVKNASGEIINYISIKRDVTEKVRLESIAQAVDTMKNVGYIFAGVSHEVGNPVNAIGINLNIIKKRLNQLPKEKIAEYVDRASGQLARVQYLLSSLKNFNMYENLRFDSLEAASFFEIFLAMVKKDFEAKGVAVECRLGPDCPRLYADPRALQQVLLNIMTNASDALEGRQNPQIVITVSPGPDHVKIRVCDNGRGIEEAGMKNLFKPFHTTKKHGTGLGMVIVKKMIARMNGTIAVTSRINEGTTVELCLPYKKSGSA